MIGQMLLINAVLLFIYMTVWFGVAYKRQRLDTVDTAWGLGFVVAAWAVAIQADIWRDFAVALLTTIWGARLANHIWQRSKTRDEDPRYEEISKKWKGNYWLRAYLSIFLVQGVLIWVVSLPIVWAANTQLMGWAWLTGAGVIIWAVGFRIEAKADKQLANFLKDKNHPKVLQTGLWRYSRHPNYFGELTQWWGIGVIALQASLGWVGLVGPLTLSMLIIFVSGIPPIEKRRLKDPEYQAYKQHTSPLIPLPPRN